MIERLSLQYPVSAIALAISLSRSGVYYILRQRGETMNKIERIRKKYGQLKYKFDNLCREFPKYGYASYSDNDEKTVRDLHEQENGPVDYESI